eukprot:1147632-Pelagomonas_calceolata.AAC.7
MRTITLQCLIASPEVSHAQHNLYAPCATTCHSLIPVHAPHSIPTDMHCLLKHQIADGRPSQELRRLTASLLVKNKMHGGRGKPQDQGQKAKSVLTLVRQH